MSETPPEPDLFGDATPAPEPEPDETPEPDLFESVAFLRHMLTLADDSGVRALDEVPVSVLRALLDFADRKLTILSDPTLRKILRKYHQDVPDPAADRRVIALRAAIKAAIGGGA